MRHIQENSIKPPEHSGPCIKQCFKTVLFKKMTFLPVGISSREQCAQPSSSATESAYIPGRNTMIRTKIQGARTSPAAREQDEKTSTSPPSQSERFFPFLFFPSCLAQQCRSVCTQSMQSHRSPTVAAQRREKTHTYIQSWRRGAPTGGQRVRKRGVVPVRKRRSVPFDPLHSKPPPP